MGAIRINTNNNGALGSTLITVDPGTVYSINSAGDSDLEINALDSAGNTVTTKLVYTQTQGDELWQDYINNGRQYYQDYFGVDPIIMFANEALERALSLALQGDEIAVFAMNVAGVSDAAFDTAQDCQNRVQDCEASTMQKIDEALASAQNAGFSTFRLPEGGGIVSTSISNDSKQAYAKSLCGDGDSCKLEAIDYRAMSIFKEVTNS